MNKELSVQNHRLATLVVLHQLAAQHLDPAPPISTIRTWCDRGKVPRFKSNPTAPRGGGTVYYSVPHFEKLLRSRVLPGKLGKFPNQEAA